MINGCIYIHYYFFPFFKPCPFGKGQTLKLKINPNPTHGAYGSPPWGKGMVLPSPLLLAWKLDTSYQLLILVALAPAVPLTAPCIFIGVISD